MYAYIKGILVSKSENNVILENTGIGYRLSIGRMTYYNLPEISNEVLLHTYHYLREDREELYGFYSAQEKELFEILIGLSSIGPSKAINIMSQIAPEQFIEAIRREDVMTIANIKGIGRKTAERMILDLKDKLIGISFVKEYTGLDKDMVDDTINALLGLGFKENIAHEMLNAVRDDIKNDDKVEDVIKKALKGNG